MPDSGFIQIEGGEVVGCNLNYGNFNVTYDGSNFNSSRKEETPKFTIVVDSDSNGEVSLKDKICIGEEEKEECFYVVGFDIDGNVRMLTEWNLNVGYDVVKNGSNILSLSDMSETIFDEEKGVHLKNVDYIKINTKNVEIKQDNEFKGYIYNSYDSSVTLKGVINFAFISKYNRENGIRYGYWSDDSLNLKADYGSEYPSCVYDDNVIFSEYIKSYVDNLKIKYGKTIIGGDLITRSELESLGCVYNKNCKNAPDWTYRTSYWTSTASSYYMMAAVDSLGGFGFTEYYVNKLNGVRPVITIPKSIISK